MADTARTGVVVLDAHRCWELLRSVQVGRLALIIDGRPKIYPLNFVTDHGTIVFRTAEGSKLSGVLAHRTVAFEADGVDPESETAWSVVVSGEAEEIRTTSDALVAMSLPLYPWHTGPKNRFVRIVPEGVTGRQFEVADVEVWRSPMIGATRAPTE